MAKTVIGEVRLSYAHLHKPFAFEGSDPQYSVCLLIPKDNKELVAKIKKAIAEAAAEGIATKWGGKKPSNLKNPLRDGDEEKPDDENYKGMYFINAKSKTAPELVVISSGAMMTATEESTELTIYSGCYGHVSVSFFPYKFSGNNGVGCGLNNVAKTREGGNLTGKSNAKDDFKDLVSANLDDLFDEQDEDDPNDLF